MAFLINLNDTIFFVSVRVRNSVEPTGRTDTFTSARIEPSSIFALDTPSARAISRISRR